MVQKSEFQIGDRVSIINGDGKGQSGIVVGFGRSDMYPIVVRHTTVDDRGEPYDYNMNHTADEMKLLSRG